MSSNYFCRGYCGRFSQHQTRSCRQFAIHVNNDSVVDEQSVLFFKKRLSCQTGNLLTSAGFTIRQSSPCAGHDSVSSSANILSDDENVPFDYIASEKNVILC